MPSFCSGKQGDLGTPQALISCRWSEDSLPTVGMERFRTVFRRTRTREASSALPRLPASRLPLAGRQVGEKEERESPSWRIPRPHSAPSTAAEHATQSAHTCSLSVYAVPCSRPLLQGLWRLACRPSAQRAPVELAGRAGRSAGSAPGFDARFCAPVPGRPAPTPVIPARGSGCL